MEKELIKQLKDTNVLLMMLWEWEKSPVTKKAILNQMAENKATYELAEEQLKVNKLII